MFAGFCKIQDESVQEPSGPLMEHQAKEPKISLGTGLSQGPEGS